jgi:hypothetical protein
MAKFLDARLKINTSGLRTKLNSKRSLIAGLPKQAYNYFVKITPIDSGFARKHTELRGDVIHAQYAYAYRLDKQKWSKQAPRGMTVPTVEYIRDVYNKYMRKK